MLVGGESDEVKFRRQAARRMTAVTCLPPPMRLSPTNPSVTVELTLALNGHHFVSATPPLTYSYYHQHIVRMHPTGGPVGGGTVVTLFGYGMDALNDGGAALRCRFGDQKVRVRQRPLPSHRRGVRTLFELRCRSPPARSFSSGPQPFSVSINSLHFLAAPASHFTYYADPHVYGIRPTGGPVRGGTHVTLLGSGFHGLGGDMATARCKFGTVERPGRVVSISADGTSLVCLSPVPTSRSLDASRLRLRSYAAAAGAAAAHAAPPCRPSRPFCRPRRWRL